MADRPAPLASDRDGELVELTPSPARNAVRDPHAPPEGLGDEGVGRFRRRFERIRGVPDPDAPPVSLDNESELKLELLLLREENARLKAARHQPSSAGTAIDRVRWLSKATSEGDTSDDAWSVLSECLAIREGLDEVCLELQAAISATRERLSALTLNIEAELRGDEPPAQATNPLSA